VAGQLATYQDYTIFNGSPTLFKLGRKQRRWFPRSLEIRGGERPYASEAETVPVPPYDEEALSLLYKARERNITYSAALLDRFTWRLQSVNPGAVGLINGAGLQEPPLGIDPPPLTSQNLFNSIVSAVTTLEANSYAGPYYCILSNEAFIVVNSPTDAMILPSDRIVPFLGREILHSGQIGRTVPPYEEVGTPPPPPPPPPPPYTDVVQGVVLSLVGNTLDLAVAVEPTPEFVTLDDKGAFHFRIYERFALRIKQPNAIVKLLFRKANPPANTRGGQGAAGPGGTASGRNAVRQRRASSSGEA